jgi:uncharacterized protein YdaT
MSSTDTKKIKELMKNIRPQDIDEWLENDTVNPKTGHVIKKNGPTYMAFKLKHEQIISKQQATEEKFKAAQEEEPLETREGAMRIIMLNQIDKDKLVATKLATANRSMRDYYKSLPKLPSSSPSTLRTAPLNHKNLDEFLKPLLVYNGVQITMDDVAKNYMINIINNVILEVRNISKKVRASPKNRENYVRSLLMYIQKHPNISQKLYTSYEEIDYRSLLTDISLRILYYTKQNLLNSDNMLKDDYEPFLFKIIYKRYDVNELTAHVIAAYAEASAKQVLNSAVSQRYRYYSQITQPFTLLREDFA